MHIGVDILVDISVGVRGHLGGGCIGVGDVVAMLAGGGDISVGNFSGVPRYVGRSFGDILVPVLAEARIYLGG